MKRFDIISLFPQVINSYCNTSLFARAQKKKILRVRAINLREFGLGQHKTVDLPPYGGGPGMVLKVEPIIKAVSKAKKGSNKNQRVILFSLRGKLFTQREAKRLSRYDHLIFISGRYEGVDERIAQYIADEEISLGNFVLSGGELPALTVVEAVSRYVPGFLGKEESREDERGSYPVYTRPPVFEVSLKGKKRSIAVPKVLLEGNHKMIEQWRRSHGQKTL